MIALLEHDDCVELREWNCWSAWLPIEDQRRVYETALRRRRTIGGHLEGLAGPTLQASIALGIRSEHEAVTAHEALERVELGATVQIRGGSAARDFADLVPAITEHGADPGLFSFCTDEQELASMAESGHIDRLVRRAIREGVPPIDAVRMATLNAARGIGVDNDYGSITPGRVASIVAVEELASLPIAKVFSRGALAAEDGAYRLAPPPAQYGPEARESIVIRRPLTRDDFLFELPDGDIEVRVIGITPGRLATEERIETVAFLDGRPQGADGVARIAVIDRHLGGQERALGLIRGLDVADGAVAMTANPGMMNLVVVGVDEDDMCLAASRVAELGGGFAVAAHGRIHAEVALPIRGIVSDAPSGEVVERCIAVEHAIRDAMGSPFDGFISAAGFACLAVSIPSLKITSRGLARVSRSEPTEAVPFRIR
ncbi:adenine deaminase C-terminal domain-containing protein [Microbacterium sp. ASV81]|uniref:Adenine deaminase C-terminal domain-containing protein n=2 Tax=Microbacterium capsulatum TaxID=3041921 RepID=A0ABU0XDZ8_9MICO|nr:adenine deaminase C-terminal domain-containing protein [Microbacterium sp. ASV81]